MRFKINGRGLIVRLVSFSLALLLLLQVIAFTVVRDSINDNARAQIAHTLDTDENVWQRLLDQNAERLRQGSALLAADYGFRSAVNSDDQETIQSVLENHGGRIGATVTALLDTQFQTRVISMSPGATPAAGATDMLGTLQQLLPQLSGPNKGKTLAVIGSTAYQFVMVPIKAPTVMGWVLMGFPIDQHLANEMNKLLAVDVALRVTGQDGRVSVPVSTLPAQSLAELSQQATPPKEVVTEKGTLLVRATTLPSIGGQTQVLLLRSVDKVVAPFRQLQILLAVITVAGVLLFALFSVWMAQRVSGLFEDLVKGTKLLSKGDYGVPMAHTQRRDEIGTFARSFDRMRLDVATQQNEVKRLAYTDRLTGLPNRVRLRDELVGALSTPLESHRLAVLTLDLDRFKTVNDVLGYAVGDQMLRAVAERLCHQITAPGSLVTRMGGNEFSVLLPGASVSDAMAVAGLIVTAFEKPLTVDMHTVDLSAGIGIACWPDHAQDADTLLNRSEIAMYQAKRKLEGPVVYTSTIDSSSAETLSLLTELRRAVDQNELRLFLQPKIALQGQGGMAAEALVRWQHPERGLVPPMQFIPFAEQTGFIRQLTLWMLEEAAKLLAAPDNRDLSLRISVNLSTRDLLDAHLSQYLTQLMQRHSLAPSAFCLEITESAIMDDPARAEAMLNRLSEQGFKLSIDDFGTGYSSLAYLKRLPVDELKIDKSFVMGMEHDQDDAKIVRSTIDLAHNLGLSVVAEGVENQAILEQLTVLKCDEAQGYHISRPMPAADFLVWLRQKMRQSP